jgi:hypothetical protein
MFSPETVKDYLEEYFTQSQRALGENVDQNLYLLCIQCFEVGLMAFEYGTSSSNSFCIGCFD